MSVPLQQSLWDSEPPLAEVTFCVVDLETSGTSAQTAEITEFGAVKVRGGRVLGEFGSFVRIEGRLAPEVVRLTGITQADLEPAPPIGQVFAAFLEFAAGSVLVAHNSRFDIGFLKAAAERCGFAWEFAPALCTLQLARRILPRGETRSYRLGDLARHFRSGTEPNHRALADARATVDVLHGLFERVGNCGVDTLTDLRGYDGRLAAPTRRKVALTDALPQAPGVYVFRDAAGTPLYIGSSINVRARARSYFSGGDTRTRMRTMVGLAERVEHVECANELEAWLREEQLIDALQPPFNRRSRAPRKGWWLSAGPKVERTPVDGALGPFRTKNEAREAGEILGAADASRWSALCDGSDIGPLTAAVAHVEQLAAEGRFELAARRRDALAPVLSVLARVHALAPLAACAEIVLAQALGRTWTFAVVRYGRLAAAGTLPHGGDHACFVARLRAGAQHVERGPGPFAGATPAQVALIARWMDARPTRIVAVDGDWSEPAAGAQPLAAWAAAAATAARDARRALRAH